MFDKNVQKNTCNKYKGVQDNVLGHLIQAAKGLAIVLTLIMTSHVL